MDPVITPYKFRSRRLKTRLKVIYHLVCNIEKGIGRYPELIKSIFTTIFPYTYLIYRSNKILLPIYMFIIIVSFPSIVFIRIIRPLIHIRFGRILASNIGQFAQIPEVYLSRKVSGKDKQKTFDLFFLEGLPCNKQIDKMVKRNLFIHPLIQPFYESNLYIPGWKKHIIKSPPYFSERDTDHSFIHCGPQLLFKNEEQNRAEKELLRYNMKPDMKYVCLYIRDIGYSITSASEAYCYDINDFNFVARELVNRGFRVLRMGKNVSIPFKTDDPNIVDYAYNYQDDFMDIWLPAHCEFMVSTGGGLDVIPINYRKPLVYVNCYDYLSFYSNAQNSLVSFKKLINNGKPLTMSQIIFEVGWMRMVKSPQYEKQNKFEIKNQSKDEILLIIDEMIMRLNNEWIDKEDEKELRDKFWMIFNQWNNSSKMNIPFHQMHGKKMLSRIGYDYLKQNQDWLLS